LYNGRTRKQNFLEEARLEFHFVTVWAAQDPTKYFHHLAHFEWSVQWHFTFQPADFSKPKGPWLPPKRGNSPANGIFVRGPFPGGPGPQHIVNVLPGAANAKTDAEYSNDPVYRRPHPSKNRDEVFDVDSPMW
jgi:hypothetical protein